VHLRPFAAMVSAILLFLLTACGAESEEAEASASPTTAAPSSPAETARPEADPEPEPEPEPAAGGTTITSAGSDFGPMLFNTAGQAIYIWELEPTATPQCYGDCAVAWPPVLTDGAPVAAGDVQSGLLGTVQRSDGATQVTYNGHPLYYYVDEGPGEVRCHNVATHGGLWWVITPEGNRAA
jgi:predicted lipoprotein with Yx(FWY)xxD motif